MWSAKRSPRTTLACVLASLAAAVLPPSTWASCSCGPAACGQGEAGASCYSGDSQQSQSVACCTQETANVESSCCCTGLTGTFACRTDGGRRGRIFAAGILEEHGAQGCECSPVRPDPLPAQPVFPVNAAEVVDFLAWSPAAMPPPLEFNLSSLDAAASFHSPPIPWRELYCVWRN
jgi:hypothetical protein